MKSSYERVVSFADIDANGKMSFGKLIDYMQDSSNRQSGEMGIGIDYQNDRKKAWILNSWHISFEEMNGDFPGDCEKLVVSTWPYEFNKIFGLRNYSIARENSKEKYIVKGQGRWFLYNTETERIEKITDEDKEKYGCVDEKLQLEEVGKKIEPGIEYEKKDIFIVRKYHLDVNNHMNNAWYVKIAEEFIEKKENVKYLRVEYRLSAKLGDEVIPFICYDNNRVVVELRRNDNKIYAICEFVMRDNKHIP